jgi:hypothetical protein
MFKHNAIIRDVFGVTCDAVDQDVYQILVTQKEEKRKKKNFNEKVIRSNLTETDIEIETMPKEKENEKEKLNEYDILGLPPPNSPPTPSITPDLTQSQISTNSPIHIISQPHLENDFTFFCLFHELGGLSSLIRLVARNKFYHYHRLITTGNHRIVSETELVALKWIVRLFIQVHLSDIHMERDTLGILGRRDVVKLLFAMVEADTETHPGSWAHVAAVVYKDAKSNAEITEVTFYF